MTREEKVTNAIIDFMLGPEGARGKMDWDEVDGYLYDGDSNWGFRPDELARIVLHIADEAQGPEAQ